MCACVLLAVGKVSHTTPSRATVRAPAAARKNRAGVCLIRGHKRGGPLVCQSATLHHSRPEGWGARGSVLGMDSRGLDQFAMTPADRQRATPPALTLVTLANGDTLVGTVAGQDGETITLQPLNGPGPITLAQADIARRLDV